MFTIAVLSIVAGISVPATIASFERARTHSAARYLAARISRAHTEAVLRTANVGLRLSRDGDDVVIGEFVDGNRNGIRSTEISSGVDAAMNPAVRVSNLFPRVLIELPDPVTLMSFTADGTASSGTIYLRGADGSRFGVRVLGASGRTRVLRFVPSTGLWIEVL